MYFIVRLLAVTAAFTAFSDQGHFVACLRTPYNIGDNKSQKKKSPTLQLAKSSQEVQRLLAQYDFERKQDQNDGGIISEEILQEHRNYSDGDTKDLPGDIASDENVSLTTVPELPVSTSSTPQYSVYLEEAATVDQTPGIITTKQTLEQTQDYPGNEGGNLPGDTYSDEDFLVTTQEAFITEEVEEEESEANLTYDSTLIEETSTAVQEHDSESTIGVQTSEETQDYSEDEKEDLPAEEYSDEDSLVTTPEAVIIEDTEEEKNPANPTHESVLFEETSTTVQAQTSPSSDADEALEETQDYPADESEDIPGGQDSGEDDSLVTTEETLTTEDDEEEEGEANPAEETSTAIQQAPITTEQSSEDTKPELISNRTHSMDDEIEDLSNDVLSDPSDEDDVSETVSELLTTALSPIQTSTPFEETAPAVQLPPTLSNYGGTATEQTSEETFSHHDYEEGDIPSDLPSEDLEKEEDMDVHNSAFSEETPAAAPSTSEAQASVTKSTGEEEYDEEPKDSTEPYVQDKEEIALTTPNETETEMEPSTTDMDYSAVLSLPSQYPEASATTNYDTDDDYFDEYYDEQVTVTQRYFTPEYNDTTESSKEASEFTSAIRANNENTTTRTALENSTDTEESKYAHRSDKTYTVTHPLETANYTEPTETAARNQSFDNDTATTRDQIVELLSHSEEWPQTGAESTEKANISMHIKQVQEENRTEEGNFTISLKADNSTGEHEQDESTMPRDFTRIPAVSKEVLKYENKSSKTGAVHIRQQDSSAINPNSTNGTQTIIVEPEDNTGMEILLVAALTLGGVLIIVVIVVCLGIRNERKHEKRKKEALRKQRLDEDKIFEEYAKLTNLMQTQQQPPTPQPQPLTPPPPPVPPPPPPPPPPAEAVAPPPPTLPTIPEPIACVANLERQKEVTMVEMQPNIEAQAKERQHSLDMDFKSLRDGFIHNDGDVCIQIDPTMSRRYVRT